jgi:hypothetical protein
VFAFASVTLIALILVGVVPIGVFCYRLQEHGIARPVED